MEACMVKLHVETDGRGPPLLLLHGWAMHGGLFAPIIPALAKHHRVYAVDLPGHGFSEPLRPWTLETIVDALERQFGGNDAPIAVLGWSLGGAVALAWAHAHPRRIARLVLVATSPRFVADAHWPHAMTDGTLARFADELRVAYRSTLVRFLSLQLQGSDDGRATLAALRDQLFARGEPDPSVLDEALVALRAIDLRDRVAALAQPALVITGDRDTLALPAAGKWLAEALPAGRLLAMSGAAHAPFLSHRAAFTRAVLDFLAE